MVALAMKVASPLIDTEVERWSAVRRWRGDAAEAGEVLTDIGRTCCPYLTLSVLSRISQCPNPND
jgi:hypothetical protein